MSAINLKTLSNEDVSQFINSFDAVLSDCDGVLWLDTNLLPKSDCVMNTFQDLGKRTFFVTNNSSKSRAEFLEKAHGLNFKGTEENMLCTSFLAANYLKSQSFNKKVYVIGRPGIIKELDKCGIKHSEVGPDPMKSDNVYNMNIQFDPDIGAVIVGFDEHFSYPKMVKAASYLSNPGVMFIGTNTDEQFPLYDKEKGKKIIIPGTGSIVRAVETAAGRKATIMGKPEPYLASFIKREFNVDPSRTLMIGDRANTDILLGTRCGFKTLLVLSGVTNLDEVEMWKRSSKKEDKDLVPDYYIDTLGDLFPYLQREKKLREDNKI